MSFQLTTLLTVNNGDAKKRLLGISAGVAVGVTLLLLIWGAYNGIHQRELRSAWTQLGGPSAVQLTDQTSPSASPQVLATMSGDYYQGQSITLVTVAAEPGSTVRIPGMDHFPEPGQYFASPALIDLITAVPSNELGDRYGTPEGEIPETALASPDSLVVIVGQTPERLATDINVTVVTAFTGALFGGNWAYLTLAIIGAIAILIPVLLLVSIVTALGATQRRERFATLRLIGAAPAAVARIAATETAVTSLFGAMAGVILAILLAPLAALVPIDGLTFFVTDILVDPISATVIIAITIAGSTLVAWHRARRAGFGPLGASRQEHERTPRLVSVLPLIVGLSALIASALAPRVGTIIPNSQLVIIAGFVLTTIGLLIAGPYLTFLTSRIATRHARTAAGVIAFNRIRLLPRTTFRSVSGLVLALFLVSVFATAVTAVEEAAALADDDAHLSMSTLINRPLTDPTDEQISALTAAPGVEHVGLASFTLQQYDGPYLSRSDALHLGMLTAAEAATITTDFVGITPGFENNEPLDITAAPGILQSELTNPILLIATDGTAAGLERARTAAVNSGIASYNVPSTRTELQTNYTATLANSFAGLANIGIVIITLISVISLAVATIAGILARRRVFGLLRLMGMPGKTLRRIIASETALPLATVFAACIGFGVVVAWALVTGLSPGVRTIDWPGPSYYIVIAFSLILAVFSVLATFASATKNTDITSTRYE